MHATIVPGKERAIAIISIITGADAQHITRRQYTIRAKQAKKPSNKVVIAWPRHFLVDVLLLPLLESGFPSRRTFHVRLDLEN